MMFHMSSDIGITRLLPVGMAGMLAAAFMHAAPAQPSMDADIFLQSCRSHESEHSGQQDDGSLCLAYLHGYFAASNKISPAAEPPSPFMRRALRNRAPNVPTTESILEAHYCLPENFSYRDMASKVVQLSSQPPNAASATELVEAALDAEFRCR